MLRCRVRRDTVPASEEIAIVIPTQSHRLAGVGRTLSSIEKQTRLPNQIVICIQESEGNDEHNIDTLYAELHKHPAVRSRATVLRSSARGLSKNRNLGLAEANADIYVCLDDDTELLAGAIALIMNAFEREHRAAALTFRSVDHTGRGRKRYRPSSFVHSKRTIFQVSSIEIAFRRRVLDQGVRFDEDFGLGARWGLGEEVVFLSDIIRGVGPAKYLPTIISVHDQKSTGRDGFNQQRLRATGAVLRRVFGYGAPSFCAAFVIKKWLEGFIQEPLAALSSTLRGCNESRYKGAS